MLSLVLDRAGLAQFRAFLHLQLLSEEQVTAVARRVFAQVHLRHQLHPFLNQEVLQIRALVTSCLVYCNTLHGATLEDHQEATSDS